MEHFIKIPDKAKVWDHQADKPGSTFYIKDMPGVDPTGNDFWEVGW